MSNGISGGGAEYGGGGGYQQHTVSAVSVAAQQPHRRSHSTKDRLVSVQGGEDSTGLQDPTFG